VAISFQEWNTTALAGGSSNLGMAVAISDLDATRLHLFACSKSKIGALPANLSGLEDYFLK
jgi:hypothetical protein